ncbi:AAA family ATPase [Microvirga sp. P5_D2]
MSEIVSQREFGFIFKGDVVEQDDALQGQRLRVKAGRNALLGEPVPGETWDVYGWTRETAWGPQIDATRAVRVMPNGSLICDFLAAHVPGIGPERARRLWEYFGADLADYLSSESHIELIAKVIEPDRPQLAPRLAALLIRTWINASSETRLIEWLASHGFEDVLLARKVARLMGPEAVERVASNPYSLVPLLPWSKVDHLGLRVLAETGSPNPHHDIRRLVGAVDATVKRAIRKGHTALDDSMLREGVSRALGVNTASGRVTAAIDAGERNIAVVRQGGLWRAPGAMTMEEAVTEHLRKMVRADYPCPVRIPSLGPMEQLLDTHESKSEPLHPEQREAIIKVLRSPLACLQGGAGVGKTYTTRMLCDIWEDLGGRVLLCALAGKAALRLSRATGRLARTLARTLADLIRRETLKRTMWDEEIDSSELNKIVTKLKTLAEVDTRTLVIIDEASMVDLPTMHALLRRMPIGSRLLLVGDQAQLPPIGFGLVYHRLVRDRTITFRLETVHRQAAETGIPGVAATIRSGSFPSFRQYRGQDAGVSFIPCPVEELPQRIERTVYELGGHVAGLLIITATNEGPAGVNSINSRLHRLYLGSTDRPEIKGHFGQRFAVGEPVIHLRNDYSRGLFNGLLGMITAVDTQSRSCTVSFDGEADPHDFNTEQLIDLSLAYAVTCHKAQGSSAPRVMVPVYKSFAMDPSWIYTALTRAEKQTVFIGDPDVLHEALRGPSAADRRHVGFDWTSNARTLPLLATNPVPPSLLRQR